MFHTTKRGLIIALLILTIGGGCNTITRRAPRMPWQDKDEEDYGEPAKLVAIWQDQVVVPPGGRATRGFGGRVYFYDAAQKPVRVRGTFTVYAYNDDAEGNRLTNKPDRKYVFDECDLQDHYSMSKIGHSYSFWIPWDAVGGDQCCITLAPFFQAEQGALVTGDQGRMILMGQVKPEDALPPAEAVPQGPVVMNYDSQPVSYVPPTQQGAYPQMRQQPMQQPVPHPTLNREHLNTTTIPVPSTLEQRLMMRTDSGMVRHPAPQQQTMPVSGGQMQMPVQQQPRNFYQQGAAEYAYPPPGQPQQQQLQRPRTTAVQNYQPWMREGAGGMRAGINIQSFQPQFADSQKFSEYLATGRMPTEEAAAVQPAAHFSPQSPQAPSSQTAPPQYGGPQNQPYQSTWPPVHPSLQLH